ncbi:MAG: ribosome biogenesis protein ytm1, partial [Pleopsidium flavum]
MPSQVPDEQLAQAVLRSAKDGVYPDSEEVITAEVPPTTLPILLQLLDKAREEVKINIRELSRGTAPDIDGWISQAKQLQGDIEESRASARGIVRQSEVGKSLEDQVDDASSKVDLLKGEVSFNETLAETLGRIQRIHQLLHSVQEAALGDRLVDAIVWLENAQKEIGMLRAFENTRIATVLKGKAADLHKAIVETIDDCWNALISMDQSTGRIKIKHEIQRASLVDVHTIVMALTKLGLVNSRINELYQGFDKIILAPRLT